MDSARLKRDVIVHQEKETIVSFHYLQHLIHNGAKTRPGSHGADNCRWQGGLNGGRDRVSPFSV